MSENNLWFFLFSIIVGITIGFTIVSFWVDDQSRKDFSKNVAIILIPIVAGAVITKFTTNSWQVTKEKIAIKQCILNDYADSYKKMSILQDNFVFTVIEKYVIFTNDDSEKQLKYYSRSEQEIFAYLPDKIQPMEVPKEKCKKEYEKVRQELHTASILQNKFISEIRLHFDNDILSDRVGELKKLIDTRSIIIQRFMISCNTDELKEFFERHIDTISVIKNKFKEIEMIMIKQKFREVGL